MADSATLEHVECEATTLDMLLDNLGEFAAVPGGVVKLRELVLDLAVRGKLLTHDTDNEFAESVIHELVVQLATLSSQLRINTEKNRSTSNRIAPPFELPDSWHWVVLGMLGVTQTGTTPSTKARTNCGSFVPFLNSGNATNGRVDCDGEGLSEVGLLAGGRIPGNCVIMVSIGGSIGRAAIVNRVASCNQQIKESTCAASMHPPFVLFAVWPRGFPCWIEKVASSGPLPIFSKSKWNRIPAPLPRLAEQKRIVAKVDGLLAEFDQLAMQLKTRGRTIQGLLEEAVHGVLEGA